MKKIFKTSDRYMGLQGRTVAVRTIEKKESRGTWDMVNFERSWDLVCIDEISTGSFVTPENEEYSFGDIIKVF